MALKPVADALILELEPVVDQNLSRHIQTEELWYAHDYVPFDKGENFAFLGGKDWEPSDMTLPRHITDALEILLITKDNLAGYHRELVFHFILEERWGRWIGRWTAEEHLHAVALRNYLVVTREIDPAANEDVRVEHVMKGYRADTYSQLETLAFMSFFERAHEEFFANLVEHCLKNQREETVAAIAKRAAELDVIGGDIDAYADKRKAVAGAGIFDESTLRTVISDRIKAWGLADHPDLAALVTQ